VDPRAALVSPHFSFWELTRTDHRAFMDEQTDPPPQVRANLVRLAFDMLEPVRALVGPLRVNSGWRCPGLNAAIGGSKTSAHMDGLAADVFPLGMPLAEAFTVLAQSGLAADQLIYEFGRWIHIGAPRHAHEPRLQRLAIYYPGKYEQWNPTDPRFRGVKEHA
jgi:zinc D-Ala-D-Ala carboxypeptidase